MGWFGRFVTSCGLAFLLSYSTLAQSDNRPSVPPQGAIAKHLKSPPYVRTILPRAESDEFLQRYIEQLDGHIGWEFELPDVKARLVGVESHNGNVSVEFIDNSESLPIYARETKVMYVCDNVDATLKAAQAAGMQIVEQATTTTSGVVGSFELIPGYVVQLITPSSDLKH